MTADTTRSDHLQRFQKNPSAYNEIISQFDDEQQGYKALRDAVKKSVGSFDEYIQFYERCIEEGTPSIVYRDLGRNAARSLKNMVLGDSPAGRRFEIRTATEFQYRVKAYQTLGEGILTDREAASTLLEHIYGDDQHRPYADDILGRLLSDIPDSPTKGVEMLIRARFVAEAETIDPETELFNQVVESFIVDLPDPYPDDTRTGSECIEAAKELSYAEPEKVNLVQAALVREPDLDYLEEYLYLSARDIVERYRHSSRRDPGRGELQLVRQQWNCIQNLFADSMSAERQARTKSYKQVADGVLKSGGRWQSHVDDNDLPNANFIQASKHYMRAAVAIAPVDFNRYVKYVSKAFRNQAIGAHHQAYGPAKGWRTSQRIHERAPELILQLASDDKLEEDDELEETINKACAQHGFRAKQAAAVTAVLQGDPDTASKRADEAWDRIDTVPTYIQTDLLETVQEVARAQKNEDVGDFEQAIRQYTSVNSSLVEIGQRIALVQIKQSLVKGDYDGAIERAETGFGENSLITIAVQIISEEQATTPGIKPPLLENLTGTTPDQKNSFANFVYLAQIHTEAMPTDEITSEVEKLLLEL